MSFQRESEREELIKSVQAAKLRKKRWRWAIATIVILALLVGAASVFAQKYLEPILKAEIETRGSLILEAPVRVDRVLVQLLPLPCVTLTDLHFGIPKAHAKGSVERMSTTISLSLLNLLQGRSLGVIAIDLDRPQIEMALPRSSVAASAKAKTPNPSKTSSAPTQAENPPPIVAPLKLKREFAIRLKVHGGNVHATRADGTDVRLDNFEFNGELPNINEYNGHLETSATAHLKQDDLSLDVPFQIASGFSFDGTRLDLDKTTAELFGLDLNIDGWQNFASGRAEWRFTGHLPDLAKVSVPPKFLPPGKWSGGIKFRAEASSDAKEKGWRAHLDASADRVRGTEIKLDRPDVKLTGEARADGNLLFDVSPDPEFERNSKYAFSFAANNFAVDLTNAELERISIFKKPREIPLTVTFTGSGDQNSVDVKDATLKFANLLLNTQGLVSLDIKRPSRLRMKTGKTDLAGWERYFPPLSQSPVKGSVELDAELSGNLRDPETLGIKLQPLRIDHFAAMVDWASADKSKILKGPFTLQTNLELVAAGRTLKSGHFQFESELTQLDILSAGSIRKKAGFPLRLSLNGEQKGPGLNIGSSQIQVGKSEFAITGFISNPARPHLDLKLASAQLRLGELASLSPSIQQSANSKDSGVGALDGSGNFHLNLNGDYDFGLGLSKSPLKLSGAVKLHLPQYMMAKASEPSSAKAPPAPAKLKSETKSPDAEKGRNLVKPEALLPDWPIARSANIKAEIALDLFVYDVLTVKGLTVNANLNNGDLTGSAGISDIFGGSVRINQFHLKPSVALPVSSAEVTFTNTDIQQASAFAAPDWRELVKGSASGKLRLVLPHPSAPQFIEGLRAEGPVRLKNGFFSTVQIDKAINEAVAKIPGLANAGTVNSKGVTADISSDVRIEKKVSYLTNFVLLTPEKNELRASGTVGFDKSVDLSGTAYLATAPIGGAVRSANSDASGRFVIPLRIQGNLTKPTISFAETTVRELLKKTAEQELKKGVQQKLEQLQDSVKKKGLEGLKDLFK